MLSWSQQEPEHPIAPPLAWRDRHIGWIALGSSLLFVVGVLLVGR